MGDGMEKLQQAITTQLQQRSNQQLQRRLVTNRFCSSRLARPQP